MTAAEAIKSLKPPITVEQWAELEGPPHYELVDGALREKPDVAIWQDYLIYKLLKYFIPYLGDDGVMLSSTAKVKIDRYHGRQPDLMYIPSSLNHLVGNNLFKGVPPLVIEILSPSTEDVDREEKYREYARLGIGQYWIIDFPNRTVEVHELRDGSYRLAERVTVDLFRPGLFPGLELRLNDIWPTEFENRTDE